MIRKVDGYQVDDDAARVDLDAVWHFLSTQAYWARWRTRADLERQVSSAWRVAAAYHPDEGLVGFGRAFSDGGVAMAYLADVFVLPAHRGHGLGEAISRMIVDDGTGRDFRWMLHTADAHGLYARLGFTAPGDLAMERPAPRR